MGSGSSKPKTVSRQIQVPSAPKSRTQTRTPSPPFLTKPSNYSRRPFSSQSSPWIPKTNVQREISDESLSHYASIWEQNGKLSSKFQQLLQSESTKILHEQKESHSQTVTTKHRSEHQLAEIESTLTTEMESIHDLTTSDRLDILIDQLKKSQLDFDESVKRRIGQVTNETESILSQIVEETQASQQELLIHAKEQQTIEDEEYRQLLEEFIAQLDDKRAKQLAFIQSQLEEQRLRIYNQSQLKIRALSEQANSAKGQIMSQEERKASEIVDSLVTEINSISTDSTMQQIGTVIKTNINLIVHEKVRSNTSEKESHHNFDKKHQVIKRTTYIGNEASNEKIMRRPSSSRLSDHQANSIQQIVKQNPVHPKTKSQKPQ